MWRDSVRDCFTCIAAAETATESRVRIGRSPHRIDFGVLITPTLTVAPPPRRLVQNEEKGICPIFPAAIKEFCRAGSN